MTDDRSLPLQPIPSPPSYHISYGPHIRSGETTSHIMWLVNISLIPAGLWGCFVFGWSVAVIVTSAIFGAVAGEHLICLLRHRRTTIFNGSAVCTGILLAYTLPPGLSFWMPALGAFLAIIFAKEIFGGLGYNIFNIALIGRAMMMASFPLPMTTGWIPPRWLNSFVPDAITTSTPLTLLKEKGFDEAIRQLPALSSVEGWHYMWRLVFGFRPGSVGEVSVLLLLLGALFLVWKGILRLYIPLSILAGLFLVTLFSEAPMLHMFSGGVWLGALYMATDYVTSPTLPKGQIVYGFGIGILTGIIRLYGGYPEGICYAILLMNIVTPALNDWFRPARISTMGVP